MDSKGRIYAAVGSTRGIILRHGITGIISISGMIVIIATF